LQRGLLTEQCQHQAHQSGGPEAENHLDLTEQVPQTCMAWLTLGELFKKRVEKA